ncbi:hypothetical protein GCM10007924_31490 [Sneathiella chinensis]|uniref:Uncharacterized protein n=1 Tax=Sneathiella chinensis TaxID=349750 RepID=A0ABQ5U738_9PROT|nr:hypothetical protein GCM10007924_31490 [Sneathiella chinensis]
MAYVTSKAEYEPDVMEDARRREQRPPRFYKIIEANRWKKADLIRQCAQILAILIRERPHVIVTTGAAPGFFALLLGKILRSRTIWIDSIANAEEMSLSGQKAKSFADLWLTQWEHLSGGSGGGASPDRDKPDYKGAVL